LRWAELDHGGVHALEIRPELDDAYRRDVRARLRAEHVDGAGDLHLAFGGGPAGPADAPSSDRRRAAGVARGRAAGAHARHRAGPHTGCVPLSCALLSFSPVLGAAGQGEAREAQRRPWPTEPHAPVGHRALLIAGSPYRSSVTVDIHFRRPIPEPRLPAEAQ